MSGVLVIGYGNPLRGDDGVGPAVAGALAAPGPASAPTAVVLDPVQLTPELAAAISQARAVIFVDASLATPPGAVVCQRLDGATAPPAAFSHTCTPALLLALARDLFGASPPAWLVSIGVASCAPGEALSPAVQAALPAALEQIHDLMAAVDDHEGGAAHA